MPKTMQQDRADFVARGETIKDRAERRGFPLPRVRAVMCGNVKGRVGISHRVSVELGLNEPTEPGNGAA